LRPEIPNLSRPLERLHTERFQVVPAQQEESVSAGDERK
jgi:hypothetical protein